MKKEIKGKFIKTKEVKVGDVAFGGSMVNEFFIRYDTGGANQDSIQGVVVEAYSAKEALVGLGEEVGYFKLLRVERI